MAAPDDDVEKEHEPTERKMEDARKQGDIPRSADVQVTAAYGGLLLAITVSGPWTIDSLGSTLAALLSGADRLAASDGAGQPVLGALLAQVAVAVAPVLVFPAALVVVSLVVLRSVVFAPQKVTPKVSRISILANAKNRFGRSGMFEFAKSAVKLMVFSAILAWLAVSQAERMLATHNLPPAAVGIELAGLATRFLFLALCVAAAIGVVDFLWQSAEHKRRNRMSRKELQDEAKQSEGDPHMKQQRRQRGYEIAMNRMLGDVPGADVVIVNPTHYAVALKWTRAAGAAPVCVAKGVDHVAARIRAIAAESGVPLHRDPPTARAVHDNVTLGQEIRPEDYAAVAAAIRFAETMRRKSEWMPTTG